MRIPLRSKAFWLLVYGLVLAASTVVRQSGSETGEQLPGQVLMELPELTREGTPTGRTVQLAYRDFRPKDNTEAPVVVLVHGSPVASRVFNDLATKLSTDYRVLVPDLPGFGGSTRRVKSHSLKAHAHYLQLWLEKLEVSEAQFLGYSMGGGVILYFYELEPDKTKSLVMLSAIGVQELELTSNYTLNHAIHAVQLAGIWSLFNLTPHFGFFDQYALNPSYAYNFYESNQQPLRGILQSYREPMLIIHGKEDTLVPYSAALEHRRIVPQSELLSLEGGHLLLFRAPELFENRLSTFLKSVEQDRAPGRKQATEARMLAATEPFGEFRMELTGAHLIVVMILIALATLISEDLACISAGILAATGTLPYTAAAAACFAGIFTGDTLIFLAGRTFGRRALNVIPIRWILVPSLVDVSVAWLRRRGGITILITRFIPGTRLPTYFAAGIAGLPIGKFLLFFACSSLLWAPLLTGFAYFAGKEMLAVFDTYEDYALRALLVLIALVMLIARVLVPCLTWRGRRLLLGKWRRWTQWEYWPRQVVYPPILLYAFFRLSFKFGGLRTVALCNPGMSGAGGFRGESKAQILGELAGAGERVAAFRLLPSAMEIEARKRLALELLEEAGPFRVVLKPDKGERGNGVVIAKNVDAVTEYLKHQKEDCIAQEYAGGVEYGIFYYRYPDEEKGRIFSITEKRYPVLTGDGEQTLERLILSDERAVCMAKSYFIANAGKLDTTPAAGERVQLVELGTHSRGCQFLDGSDILTEALTEAIDAVAKHYEGFYFGRFDIKAPDKQALMEGREFKVLELNGMTSEAAHIYDPHYNILDAWRTLAQQWHIAYRIAWLNRQRGGTVPGYIEALTLLFGSDS